MIERDDGDEVLYWRGRRFSLYTFREDTSVILSRYVGKGKSFMSI